MDLPINTVIKHCKLDDTIAESHIAKARVHLFYEKKWEAAYESLQKAFHLNPAAIETYDCWLLLYRIGKKDEAIKILEKALEIDPLSTVINNYLGEAYAMAWHIMMMLIVLRKNNWR